MVAISFGIYCSDDAAFLKDKASSFIFMCIAKSARFVFSARSYPLFVIDRSIRDESSSINDAAVGE